jgi:acetyl esterase
MSTLRLAALVLLLVFSSHLGAQGAGSPTLEEFTSLGAQIGVRVFSPSHNDGKQRSAIVLFHGGGWNEGEASWMDAIGEQYSELGMVAVSVGYRLSRDGLTPFDAVADARNAIRWVREEADRLGIDPDKVVALGTSAGAHLASSAAIFDEPWGSAVSSAPNALVLRSPAVSVATSGWFRTLVGGAAQAAALSPDLHVRSGLPPMLLLQGEQDNVTPAAGAKRFCERMQQRGNVCQLKLYPEVGHLFTRNLANQEVPDYSAIDREVSRDASDTSIAFLKEHGFIVDDADAP